MRMFWGVTGVHIGGQVPWFEVMAQGSGHIRVLDKGSGFRFQGSASGFSVHDWECKFWVSALGFLGFRVSGFGSQGVGGRAYLPRGCPSISLAVGDIGGPQRLV